MIVVLVDEQNDWNMWYLFMLVAFPRKCEVQMESIGEETGLCDVLGYIHNSLHVHPILRNQVVMYPHKMLSIVL